MKRTPKPPLCHPLAWTLLLACAAGCASTPLPPVQAPERAPGAPIPLRVVPVLREGGYRLNAFEGWKASEIATLTAQLYDVTAGEEVASDTFASPELDPNRVDAGFDLGGLKWQTTYRVALRAYRATAGASEAISVDDLSSATFNTDAVDGRYPTVKTLELPLVLQHRPFPGLLDAVVGGGNMQDFMRVVLRPLEGATGNPIATTVLLDGVGTATLSFSELTPNATYVVERFSYTGTPVASSPLASYSASTTVSTRAATANPTGRVATATLAAGPVCENPILPNFIYDEGPSAVLIFEYGIYSVRPESGYVGNPTYEYDGIACVQVNGNVRTMPRYYYREYFYYPGYLYGGI